MFVDQITIAAAAGKGGDGVVRWHQEKFVSHGGPSGGNGGHGGDVYIKAVRDVNVLAAYTGAKTFQAEAGSAGTSGNKDGKNGADCYIAVPVGSTIRDLKRNRMFEVLAEGDTVRILKGGTGGLGNTHFKSSVNRSPEESTAGKEGEDGEFLIEVSLVVDVGIIGQPNAGKSSLLNALTNARSKIGAYPFTTLEPHLGSLFGYVLADIPGLMEGAAEGRGLGHTFLRHVTRTKMLVHCVAIDSKDPLSIYYTIQNELKKFNLSLLKKEEWIVLTKSDLVDKGNIETIKKIFDKIRDHVFVLSVNSDHGIKEFRDALVKRLQQS